MGWTSGTPRSGSSSVRTIRPIRTWWFRPSSPSLSNSGDTSSTSARSSSASPGRSGSSTAAMLWSRWTGASSGARSWAADNPQADRNCPAALARSTWRRASLRRTDSRGSAAPPAATRCLQGPRLLPSCTSRRNAGIDVEKVALDAYLAGERIAVNRVRFVKIDVEGFEFEVIKGMPLVLRLARSSLPNSLRYTCAAVGSIQRDFCGSSVRGDTARIAFGIEH
jgi:FkbM family methyltransferase